MNIRAKMQCTGVSDILDAAGTLGSKVGETVTFMAVYSSDPAQENYSFSQATPSASLSMYISNPAAFGSFVRDLEYCLDFSLAGTISEQEMQAVS